MAHLDAIKDKKKGAKKAKGGLEGAVASTEKIRGWVSLSEIKLPRHSLFSLSDFIGMKIYGLPSKLICQYSNSFYRLNTL